MRHAHSDMLLAYWRDRRFGETAPQRSDIDPQDIADLLGNVFFLSRVDSEHYVFRLAGTNLCSLYRREFRDQNFLNLWRDHDVAHIQILLESVLGSTSPASFSAVAYSMDLKSLPLEVSLFPLRGTDGRADRIMGLFQPLEETATFKHRPIVRTRLKEIRPPATSPNILAVSKPAATNAQPYLGL
jgi:hypothetical protein